MNRTAARRGRHHQPRHQRGGQGAGLLLRARSRRASSPARSAGNIGMNSGGAHCLKYGVTTNNVLGLKMVLMDGEVDRDRRRPSRCAGLRPAGPGRSARRASSASSPRRPCASCARPEGARPMLIGFDSSEAAGQCVVRHHRRGHHSGGHRIHGQAGDPGLRGVRQGRLSRSTSRRC